MKVGVVFCVTVKNLREAFGNAHGEPAAETHFVPPTKNFEHIQIKDVGKAKDSRSYTDTSCPWPPPSVPLAGRSAFVLFTRATKAML